MKKISIKWVAFWIFIAALIGLGTFLIVRECNYNKKTECEVVLIKPDSTMNTEVFVDTVEDAIEQFVDSVEEKVDVIVD